MAMGTIVYLSESAASMTARAERKETSCSPERPPKITPIRSFFVIKFLLENGFSQRGEDQFDPQLGRAIIGVERGIDFDDFK